MDVPDLLTYGFSWAVALLLVTGALLRLARRRPATPAPATTDPAMTAPDPTRSTTLAWANLLLGIALGLFPVSRLPHHHRLLWDDVLLPPGLLLLLASAYLHWRAWRATA